MPDKKIKIIIFDFDGTLADSVSMICKMVNEMTQRDLNQKELRKISKKGFLKIAKKLDISIWRFPFFIIKIKSRLKQKVSAISPFPGIVKLLFSLNKFGYQIAIMTNNRADIVKSFLENNNLDFITWVSGTTFAFNKAKRLEKILKKKKIKPVEAIYVGDQAGDITAAKEAGIISLAVTWGFDSKDSLMRKCPDFIASEPNDILRYLKASSHQASKH